MFFFLSKLLLFLLRPLLWALACLLWGLYRRQRRWVWVGVIILYVFGNKWLFDGVVSRYEYDPVPLPAATEVGIVLGGYLTVPTDTSLPVLELSEAADRLLAPIALYEQGIIGCILLSGGQAAIVENLLAESDWVGPYLLRMGVPSGAVMLENRSRNTYENALYTQQLLADHQPPGASPPLLITSAWHMPRSVACFRRVGLEVTPYPVDFMRNFNRFTPAELLLPAPVTLRNWEVLLKEWVGLIAYRLKGYN